MQTYVDQMKPFLAQPGFISRGKGFRVKQIYRNGSAYFSVNNLSDFGQACYKGDLELVKALFEAELVPDLGGKELPYEMGYAIILATGIMQTLSNADPEKHKHHETLEYLVSKGLPLDVPDIAGLTALHRAVQHTLKLNIDSSKGSLAHRLLELGANVNFQNRYGETPLACTYESNNYEDAEWLCMYGADLESPDANGFTPSEVSFAVSPQIHAVIQKWGRWRNGEEAPRSEKACAACGKKDIPLKNCAKCQVVRYCSRECQCSHWKIHKITCKPFIPENTVTMFPRYFKRSIISRIDPTADLPEIARYLVTGKAIERSHGATKPFSAMPKGPFPKSVVVNIRVPFTVLLDVLLDKFTCTDPLVVYTKKRDLVCYIERNDAPAAYDTVWHLVRENGVGGLNAYFSAELRSKNELVVKVAEVLAEQPF
ncbi:ankyrin repeat-containing domain protein [Cyathus striatus]|nr:ankyrin repeat-containing domain protein [Cyathus striatus]